VSTHTLCLVSIAVKSAMTENRCIIGTDAGTSAIKAVTFDQEDSEICVNHAAVPLHRPHPSWVEQDMDEQWETGKDCLGRRPGSEKFSPPWASAFRRCSQSADPAAESTTHFTSSTSIENPAHQ